MIEIVSLILKDEGYRVLQATGGKSALSVLDMIRPDLIVSDVMMPGMDGFAFYEHVRATSDLSQIPFIFLTAKAERSDVRQGMELGADDYLTKPFEPEELLSAVETRLARAAKARASIDKASADLKKMIVRIVTHELRTPLALMFGYTELLEATGTEIGENDLQAILRGLYSGTQRLMSLVEDTLLLSRLESGVLAEEIRGAPYRTAGPDRVIRGVVKQLEGQASARKVSLALHLGASGSAVAINEVHLTEVARHLVDNAIKFSKTEGGQVILTTRQEGASWVLEIADDGVGIRQEALPWVFEAFRQVDRAKMEQQGAGLGLAIVCGLAEVYGGQVAVESRLARGSRFTVRLPLAT